MITLLLFAGIVDINPPEIDIKSDRLSGIVDGIFGYVNLGFMKPSGVEIMHFTTTQQSNTIGKKIPRSMLINVGILPEIPEVRAANSSGIRAAPSFDNNGKLPILLIDGALPISLSNRYFKKHERRMMSRSKLGNPNLLALAALPLLLLDIFRIE